MPSVSAGPHPPARGPAGDRRVPLRRRPPRPPRGGIRAGPGDRTLGPGAAPRRSGRGLQVLERRRPGRGAVGDASRSDRRHDHLHVPAAEGTGVVRLPRLRGAGGVAVSEPGPGPNVFRRSRLPRRSDRHRRPRRTARAGQSSVGLDDRLAAEGAAGRPRKALRRRGDYARPRAAAHAEGHRAGRDAAVAVVPVRDAGGGRGVVAGGRRRAVLRERRDLAELTGRRPGARGPGPPAPPTRRRWRRSRLSSPKCSTGNSSSTTRT